MPLCLSRQLELRLWLAQWKWVLWVGLPGDLGTYTTCELDVFQTTFKRVGQKASIPQTTVVKDIAE